VAIYYLHAQTVSFLSIVGVVRGGQT